MLSRVLILLLVLLVVPDVYIYWTYVRKATDSRWKRALYFLPSSLLLLYLLYVLAHDDFRAVHQPMVGTFMIVVLTVTVPKMLFTLIDGSGRGVLMLFKRKSGFKTRLTAMVVAICSIFIILYGYFWGRSQYEVEEHILCFDNLPDAFDGYRILHFSDLHLGTFDDGHRNDVDSIVAFINRQRCDMVVFTGDLVNYEAAELDGYDEVLSRIQAKDGVFSVLGNHDYAMYLPFDSEEEKRADIEKIKQKERNYGWRLLLNENAVVRRSNDSIAIIGSENEGFPPWPALGDLDKATRGLSNIINHKGQHSSDHTFSILLTHDPTHWRRKVIGKTRIDLTLAGHTHAGQFKMLGWSPIRFKYKEWSGIYTEKKQVMNITDGIGNIMLPFRFGAWPEADIIVLKKSKPKH